MRVRPKRTQARATNVLSELGDRLLMISPDALKPYPRNARTHSKKQIGQIAASIRRFGFTNPVLIDDGNMMLAGHARVEAARQLGLKSVPCLRLSTLSPAEKRAYILIDNKHAQNAGWDDELLAGELEYLLMHAEEIEIDLTGFSIAEVDQLLEVGGTDQSAASAEDDRLPQVEGDPVTRPGDVWILGRSRLICGDAREEETYRRLLSQSGGGLEQAEMVFTDPPYNVPISGHVTGNRRSRHREFAMASGEMSAGAFIAFLTSTFERLAAHTRDGSIHFICMDWRHLAEILAAGGAVYSELKNLIVWVKDNGGMGSFYRSRHELVFAFKNGTGPHLNSFELGQNGRYRTNVWNYRGINSPTRESRDALATHPTVKPVAMVADALKDTSRPGGLVLDAFCGSGTILIAAQKTGRRARAGEIDPLYCDVAIRRWQAFAKDDAILADTGETFDEVAALRGRNESPRSLQRTAKS
jgi:DNA modification methylase